MNKIRFQSLRFDATRLYSPPNYDKLIKLYCLQYLLTFRKGL